LRHTRHVRREAAADIALDPAAQEKRVFTRRRGVGGTMSGVGRKRARSVRAEKAAEPKLVEGEKVMLLIRGPHTSDLAVTAMKELGLLKKPAVVGLQRKNPILPFEDATSLEFLCTKNECGAFLYVSHTKKRPHNMVLGRVFDGHLLDMVELGITRFTSMVEHKGPSKAMRSTPAFVFAGDKWDLDGNLTRLRSLLLGA